MPTNPETQTPRMHAPATLDTVVESMSALGNQLTLAQTIGRSKNQFDGLSAEKLTKWMAEVDNIFLEVKQDERQTLWAAAQLLTGSALDYYRDVAPSLDSWEHLKTLMIQRYHYLDDSDSAKQKLQQFVQRPSEPIPVYVERLQSLAKQAFGHKLSETNVVETLVRTFIDGILNRKLQEKIATRRPKTLIDAYQIAMDQKKLMTELSLYRDHSKGEPMDCSAIEQTQTDVGEVKELLKVLLQNQTSAFQVQPQQTPTYQQGPQGRQQHAMGHRQGFRQQNKFQPPRRSQPPPRAFPPPNLSRPPPLMQHQNSHQSTPHQNVRFEWTEDRRPICYYCGNAGHMQRICRKKQAAQARMQPHALPPHAAQPRQGTEQPHNQGNTGN